MAILQMFFAVSKENYWISTLSSINSTGNIFNISVDSSGNVYGCITTGFVPASLVVFKYDKNGVLQWQKSLTGEDCFGFCVDVDSSGNVYAGGFRSSGSTDLLIAKYDTNGNLQWQRSLGGSNAEIANRLAVDSSGNIYIAAQIESQGAGGRDFLTVKYDTNGNLLWQKMLGTAGTDSETDISIDSSGNSYIVGIADDSYSVIAKYDTNGNLQWQRTLTGTTTPATSLRGITADSSGNSYAVGAIVSGGQFDILIVKYDTNGNLQWQKSLGSNASFFDISFDICLDNLGYFYIIASSNIISPLETIVAKYDTNGNLQWQRSFGNISFQEEGFGIDVDNNGNLYFAGKSRDSFSNVATFIVRVPGDGSKTGTYGNFTYAVSTLPTGTTSLTSSASSLTSSTSTLTGSTSTLTNSTASLTSTTIEIP
jgi:hypothetical protein